MGWDNRIQRMEQARESTLTADPRGPASPRDRGQRSERTGADMEGRRLLRRMGYGTRGMSAELSQQVLI